MSKQKQILGFIGIGLMGKPIVHRLLEAGFVVNVWNRTEHKARNLEQFGAKCSVSVAELVNNSDVILLCLADTAVVETMVQGEGGILANGNAGKLLIDLSSIDPEMTRKLAGQLLQHCQMAWVDAPVSGGVAGAQSGTLAIMAGGNDEDVKIARIVLKPLYQQLTHMGTIGSGQVTKICNQMIVSCNVLVIAEMMAMAKQAGVAIEKIPDALAGGFADSKPLQIVGTEMATETFEPVKWRVKTLLKDLNMAIDLSANQGASVPMSGLAMQLMQLHGNKGYLDQDPSTLIKLFDKNGALRLKECRYQVYGLEKKAVTKF